MIGQGEERTAEVDSRDLGLVKPRPFIEAGLAQHRVPQVGEEEVGVAKVGPREIGGVHYTRCDIRRPGPNPVVQRVH